VEEEAPTLRRGGTRCRSAASAGPSWPRPPRRTTWPPRAARQRRWRTCQRFGHERARERERERQRQRQKRSGSARGRAEREKARQEREPPPLTFVLPYKYVGKRAINRDGATDREARQSDCLAPPVAMTLRSYPHPTRAVIKGS
jgi:hypothetical protein